LLCTHTGTGTYNGFASITRKKYKYPIVLGNDVHGWDKESQESARREAMHKELEETNLRKQYRVQIILYGSYGIHIHETVRK
jgi:hypothetical protein